MLRRSKKGAQGALLCFSFLKYRTTSLLKQSPASPEYLHPVYIYDTIMHHMATKPPITTHNSAHPPHTPRRLTNAIRETGIAGIIKGGRYYTREMSERGEKRRKLRRISDAQGYAVQRRLGKIS